MHTGHALQYLQDKLNVEAFSDPKVKGVTLYLSDFSRPVADKLINGDIFSGRHLRNDWDLHPAKQIS